MREILQALWSDESGQDLVEYGLLLTLLVVAAVLAVTTLGLTVGDFWTSNAADVSDAVSGPD